MEGRPFVHNGKTLLSGIDPVRRAEKAVDAVSIKDRTLYFCPSPIFGYGLSRLLSRLEAEAPASAVLCIEADAQLYELSQKNIDSALFANNKMHLTNICDGEKLYAFINKTWGARAFSRIETLRLSGGFQLFPQVYDSLCDTLRREFATDWSNALTLTRLGRLYIRNLIRNLALLSQFNSISNLSFGEEQVLVLGAGPSLDETLNELHDSLPKDRNFKIICVDTCLGALKERNIVPDLVVVLECQHWNLWDFIGCKGWKVPVAFDLSSLPASAKVLKGDGFLFFTPWTSLRIFERLRDAGLLPQSIAPLGSVGLTAVEIARRLTKGKIICAGLDFSFTQDKNHACSTPEHRRKLNKQTRLSRIANTAAYGVGVSAAVSKKGQSVHTNSIMKSYRNLFEQEFGSDQRIFDIEGTGLPLGVKTLTMNEALKILEDNKKNFTQRHGGAEGEKGEEDVNLNSFSASPRLRENHSRIINFLESEKKRLEELLSILTGEAAMDNERLNILITECDYLFAHFPDYAGGRKPNLNDVSFLKRVRIEIDMMLKLLVHT